eukprot:2094866-Amphidinium_carterae.3
MVGNRWISIPIEILNMASVAVVIVNSCAGHVANLQGIWRHVIAAFSTHQPLNGHAAVGR